MISRLGPLILSGMAIGGVVASKAYRVYRKDLRTAIAFGAVAAAVPFAVFGIKRLVEMVISCMRSMKRKSDARVTQPSVPGPSAEEKQEAIAKADEAMMEKRALQGAPPIPPRPPKVLSDQARQGLEAEYHKLMTSYTNPSSSEQEIRQALNDLSLLVRTFLPPETDRRVVAGLINLTLGCDEHLTKKPQEKNPAYIQNIEYHCDTLFAVGEKYYNLAQKAFQESKDKAAPLLLTAAYWLYVPARIPRCHWEKKDISKTISLYFRSILEASSQLNNDQREFFRKWVDQFTPDNSKMDEYLNLLTGCLFFDLDKVWARGFFEHPSCSENPIAKEMLKKLPKV